MVVDQVAVSVAINQVSLLESRLLAFAPQNCGELVKAAQDISGCRQSAVPQDWRGNPELDAVGSNRVSVPAIPQVTIEPGSRPVTPSPQVAAVVAPPDGSSGFIVIRNVFLAIQALAIVAIVPVGL